MFLDKFINSLDIRTVMVVKPYGWWEVGDVCYVNEVLDKGKVYQVQAIKGGPLVRLNKSFVEEMQDVG